MKMPNDTKKPNNNGGSMGQTLRRLERFIHVAVEVGTRQVTMPGGVELTVPWRTPKGEGRTYRIHSQPQGPGRVVALI